MKNIILSFSILLFAACNLTKDAKLDLPVYENRPVVECYLEPGQPMRLLLTQSFGFFEAFDTTLVDFINNATLDSARVTIEHNGTVYTLENRLYIDPIFGRLYNYGNDALVPNDLNGDFNLNIVLADGRSITGKTIILPKFLIDSVVIQFSPDIDTLARALTYVTDDTTKTNYFRRLLNYGALDSFPQQDFIGNDGFVKSKQFVFGTGYDLVEGDTVINTMFHITKDHYDFTESYQLAVQGNQNPFAQPSGIRSNLSGTANALGIFTCLVYDRDTTIVHR